MLPMRNTSCVSSTRSSFACNGTGLSPIPPRQSVPQFLGGALDDGAQLNEIDRLGEVVGGALLDGLDGGLDVAVAGDNDDLGVGQRLLGLTDDGEAVHVLHEEVGEDDIVLFLLEV